MALEDLDTSLSRMKTDYMDLWQMHALETPNDVEGRIQNGVLDVFLEVQKKGKVRYIGFTGHGSYKAHLKMLEELKKWGMKMNASQMPINPADPHHESFVTHVMPKCVEAWHRSVGHENAGLRTFLRREQWLASYGSLC
jgi:predicted aldo/keto reductase-like oxidoreductase